MGVSAAKESGCKHQIGQSEQGEQLRRIFGQSTIAGFAMAEQAFDDVEAVLDLGAHAGLCSNRSVARLSLSFLSALRKPGRMAVCHTTG